MLNRFYIFNPYFMRLMSTSSEIFMPPLEVKGMTSLDQSKFKKKVDIPYIKIPSKIIGRLIGSPCLKEFSLRSSIGIKYITAADNKDEKLMLFDPQLIQEKEDAKEQIRENVKKLADVDVSFKLKTFEIGYDDWDIKRCLRAILPDELDFSGYTQAGHILHLNLREDLAPYKFIIAQILLDKIKFAKTVVNKLDIISSEFRFFELELLAGEPNYIATVSENNFKFKLDFSKVFWNSRLNNEHNRVIVDIGGKNRSAIIFDVFAGVGPFVIPATFSKKVVKTYANDLNPISIQYLKENLKLNKAPQDKIAVYNLDGSDFIRTVLPIAYAEHLKDDVDFHVLMNLPALAVSFLPSFKGALKNFAGQNSHIDFFVHCYMFVKATEDQPISWFEERAIIMVKDQIQDDRIEVCELTYVRNVAGRKHMYCVKFKLPLDYLVSSDISSNNEEYSVVVKKQKIE